MESLDLRVLAEALEWHRAGWPVTLVTVVQTWGSAPRPPGALLAVRGDGAVSGSVSGGCVEDDLIARIRSGEGAHSDFNRKPSMMAYGWCRRRLKRQPGSKTCCSARPGINWWRAP
jgi:xanthine dehydrogenase accessory factor